MSKRIHSAREFRGLVVCLARGKESFFSVSIGYYGLLTVTMSYQAGNIDRGGTQRGKFEYRSSKFETNPQLEGKKMGSKK